MQVILEADEAWSIMMLVVSQVLDGVDLSDDGISAIKKWRTERADGSNAMVELAEAMNETMGNTIDERTTKLLRRKGRFVSTKDFR